VLSYLGVGVGLGDGRKPARVVLPRAEGLCFLKAKRCPLELGCVPWFASLENVRTDGDLRFVVGEDRKQEVLRSFVVIEELSRVTTVASAIGNFSRRERCTASLWVGVDHALDFSTLRGLLLGDLVQDDVIRTVDASRSSLASRDVRDESINPSLIKRTEEEASCFWLSPDQEVERLAKCLW